MKVERSDRRGFPIRITFNGSPEYLTEKAGHELVGKLLDLLTNKLNDDVLQIITKAKLKEMETNYE